MKIENAYGGLDMTDADVLRRMTSGKYRNKNHLIKIEDRFLIIVNGMAILSRPVGRSRGKWNPLQGIVLIKHITPALRWRVTRVYL